MVLGEQGGKVYYGKQSFLTSVKQVVNVSVEETTPEIMLQTIQSLQLDSVKVNIDKAKNFDSIKKKDEELKRYDAKCVCWSSSDSVAMPPAGNSNR